MYFFVEMIKIRDGFTFKECCILSKEDVSDITDHTLISIVIAIVLL